MSQEMSHRDQDQERIRTERVSRLMGQNLLKGFALLDQYCNVCETPLMRDPQKNLICVACRLTNQTQRGDDSPAPIGTRETTAVSPETFRDCEAALRAKLEWAVSELHSTTDVKQCIELNVLVKGLVENMKLLRDVK